MPLTSMGGTVAVGVVLPPFPSPFPVPLLSYTGPDNWSTQPKGTGQVGLGTQQTFPLLLDTGLRNLSTQGRGVGWGGGGGG